ncbi:uncharacterized protein LOC130777747 [Actinidia eriantha]|uniref:uncharacterized protein LOC130777747 n=1 Tax=Actinidia eriantha TaxID=165200 RepID=UPI002589EE48|nr:uncharacterized protein LOC130777747 [Actinidia eriantha]
MVRLRMIKSINLRFGLALKTCTPVFTLEGSRICLEKARALLEYSAPNGQKEEKRRPLPKFGDWDVNDPASADGFTVIFSKAKDDKRASGNGPKYNNTTLKTKQELQVSLKEKVALLWLNLCCRRRRFTLLDQEYMKGFVEKKENSTNKIKSQLWIL